MVRSDRAAGPATAVAVRQTITLPLHPLAAAFELPALAHQPMPSDRTAAALQTCTLTLQTLAPAFQMTSVTIERSGGDMRAWVANMRGRSCRAEGRRLCFRDAGCGEHKKKGRDYCGEAMLHLNLLRHFAAVWGPKSARRFCRTSPQTTRPGLC